jgi:predicted nucleic acid-binding protein
MRVVSNTSPLSNLAVVGEISLLQQIYPKIVIPPIVQTELTQFPQIKPTIVRLIATGWLSVESPKNLQFVSTLEQTLDAGEASAIALAIEINADRLLIDEHLGRIIAIQHGLKIRGIVGILVNAKNQGLIPEMKPTLDRLIHNAGFRVSQALYDFALRETGE